MSREPKNKTVYLGMSGGVDSSVSAALLKEQGYNVVGVHMTLQKSSDGKVINENTEVVKRVCEQLKIGFKVFDLSDEFEDTVIKYFIEEYKKGKTPNPCVHCNKNFKFGEFYRRAMSDGADFVATGHYAQVEKAGNEYKLARGIDENKDQSYFLHNLNQEILAHTLFPIGELTKPEVRRLAEKYDLETAKKKESQDVCFILNNDTQEFLRKHVEKKPGDIIDIDSKEKIGTHNGLAYYTIGQRKGMGIGGSDEPYFVVDKNTKGNILYVAKGINNERLFQKEIELKDLNWIGSQLPKLPLQCEVAIRYRQIPQEATLNKVQNIWTITFKDPVRAVSPGQSAVIYQGKYCLGGGIIKG